MNGLFSIFITFEKETLTKYSEICRIMKHITGYRRKRWIKHISRTGSNL